MRSLKEILGNRYEQCFKHYKEEDFINRGLGFMSKDHRDELIQAGAIIAGEDQDEVAMDGYCLNVISRDEATCIYEGDRFDCEQEQEKVLALKPGTKVEMKRYPKAFLDWQAKQTARIMAYLEEKKAIDQLSELGF